MSQLSIANVINVSVSETQTGIGEYNTSNIALFTNDVYANSFGTAGYAIYLDPTQVGVDFGTASETYAMANTLFSQQPNILANDGYLAVIPFIPAIQTITFAGIAASGSYRLNYGASNITIGYNQTAGSIQTALRGIAGLEQVVVAGSTISQTLSFTFYGYYGQPSAFTVSSNTLATAGSASIAATVTQTASGETLAAAITRTTGLVQYFGVTNTSVLGSTDLLAAAAVLQPLNKMGFFVSQTAVDIDPGGLLDLLRTTGYTHTRGLYYGLGTSADALKFVAGYAGRGLSTNFSGSNTTSTMHLKDLSGVGVDTTMTQTLLDKALLAGADTYISIQGVSKVFCSGANKFFDQVYNLLAFVGGLQVAGFNYLAQSSTKIPQTEAGMSGLKGAYRAVCQQYVSNQYLAAGSWTSSTTFGNQVDFLTNVAQLGYYIYSAPVSQQSQVARAARQAPLIQIAVKEAGAIQSSDVIVFVNA